MDTIFYNTLIQTVPNDVVGILQENGYKINNWNERSIKECLIAFVSRDGDDAIYQLIEIHPDYSLFEKYFEDKRLYEESLIEKKSTINQNSNSEDELLNKLIKLKMLNATGETTPAQATDNNNKIDPTNLVIVGSTLVIALALVLSLTSKN